MRQHVDAKTQTSTDAISMAQVEPLILFVSGFSNDPDGGPQPRRGGVRALYDE